MYKRVLATPQPLNEPRKDAELPGPWQDTQRLHIRRDHQGEPSDTNYRRKQTHSGGRKGIDQGYLKVVIREKFGCR